jgi:site-specific DNA recombinase
MQRSLADLDETVEAAVVGLLAMPDAAKTFSMVEDTGPLRKRLTELRDRRDALASLLAEGLLTAAAVREQSGKLSKELHELENALAAADGLNPAAAVIGSGDVAAAWSGLPLWTKRGIIRSLITITILPAGKGKDFDPEQVQIGFI